MRSQFALPCVFLSAFNSDASLQRARLAAPAGYLAKPFSDYELGSVIEAALQKEQAHSRCGCVRPVFFKPNRAVAPVQQAQVAIILVV